MTSFSRYTENNFQSIRRSARPKSISLVAEFVFLKVRRPLIELHAATRELGSKTERVQGQGGRAQKAKTSKRPRRGNLPRAGRIGRPILARCKASAEKRTATTDARPLARTRRKRELNKNFLVEARRYRFGKVPARPRQRGERPLRRGQACGVREREPRVVAGALQILQNADQPGLDLAVTDHRLRQVRPDLRTSTSRSDE